MHKKGYLILGFVLMIAVFVVLSNISFALADDNNNSNSGSGSNRESGSNSGLGGSDDDDNDNDGDRDRNRTEIRTRDSCTIKIEKEVKIENGKRVEVVERKMVCADGTKEEVKIKIENRTEDGKFREKIRYEFKGEELEVEAEEGIDLEENTTGNEYRLRARLRSTGNITNIKIMPDQASEIALERLRILNFTIELKEVVHKNVPRVVYNIEANKSGRFLGVFKLAMKVNAEVDPETGEVLDVNVPWWAFLVAEQDEVPEEE